MRNGNRLAAAILAGSVTLSHSVLAGRPLAIDDADPADPGQFEIEAGAACEYDSDCTHWHFPFGLSCGLMPGLELGVGFGGQMTEFTEVHEDGATETCRREHGIDDLVIGAKWQFLESCPLGARHALAPLLKLPTSDDDKGLGTGEADGDLTWVASWSMGENAGLHANLGYSWIGGPDDNVLHYGAALDCRATDAVQWLAEVSAKKEHSSGTDIVAQYNAGLRWSPAGDLTLDIACGSKLSGDAPDFTATVGLTWAIGRD